MKVPYEDTSGIQPFMGEMREAYGCTLWLLFFMLSFPTISYVSAYFLLHISRTLILVIFLNPFPSLQQLLYFLKKLKITKDVSSLPDTSGLTNIDRPPRALVTKYLLYKYTVVTRTP